MALKSRGQDESYYQNRHCTELKSEALGILKAFCQAFAGTVL